MSDFIATAISIAYGTRCPEKVEGCPCCDAWAQYDALMAGGGDRRGYAELLDRTISYQAMERILAAALEPAQEPQSDGVARFGMLAHLKRQREWSEKTFGPGTRTLGVIDHIRKELREIEGDPSDITEWIDVVILALDGAWRAGYRPQEIIDAMATKQAKNEARQWPDWRTMPQDKAIEHDRSGEGARE